MVEEDKHEHKTIKKNIIEHKNNKEKNNTTSIRYNVDNKIVKQIN